MFTGRLELLRHLVGDHPARRVAAEQVRTTGRVRPHRFDVARGNGFNAIVGGLDVALGLQAKYRLCLANRLRERAERHHFPADAVDQEEWRPIAERLNRHDDGPRAGLRGLHRQQPGLRANRSVAKQRRQRQAHTEVALDVGEQAHGQQRVATELEEVVVRIDGGHLEHATPERL